MWEEKREGGSHTAPYHDFVMPCPLLKNDFFATFFPVRVTGVLREPRMSHGLAADMRPAAVP